MSSLLDKLLAEENKQNSSGKPNTQQVHLIRQSIKHDLEKLLNTRRPNMIWPSEWDQLDRSLLAYGIPDTTGRLFDTPESKNEFCKELRDAIGRFEPRLKEIKVSIMPTANPEEPILSIRIEALMIVEPLPEPIIFDSTLQPDMGTFSLIDGKE